MRKFVSWRRVSTQKQGRSGLGLEAQKEMIDYFVRQEKGVLVSDYHETYTGKDLAGCKELRKAIDKCKEVDATLIIAKSDRFRNTIEALEIFDEMEGNIYFCDLPHTDKFTLTLFFALAEREALLVSIRTKAALKARVDRNLETGGTNSLWGKNTGSDRKVAIKNMQDAAKKSRREGALNNASNKFFWTYVTNRIKISNGENIPWREITEELNNLGQTTATGLPFNEARAISMYNKLKKMMTA